MSSRSTIRSSPKWSISSTSADSRSPTSRNCAVYPSARFSGIGRRYVCCCIGTSATARHDHSALIMDTPGTSGLLHRNLSHSEYLRLSKLLDESLEMAPETRSSWLQELARSE